MNRHQAFLVIVAIVLAFIVVVIDSASSGPKYQKQQKKDYKIKEKDLKEAKARWIQYQFEKDDDGDDDADMMQHPIDEPPRRRNRDLGEICTYSKDCSSGCCLMDRDSRVRSCQPKAIIGEKCSAAQVKADLYVDACPCVAGNNFCSYPNEVCTK